MSGWFNKLFAFREEEDGSAEGYASNRANFKLEDDKPGFGKRLVCIKNGASFGVGTFTTPTLGELRTKAQKIGRKGTVTVTHDAIGDVLPAHALPENKGAMFQVASQFNCLEFASPDVVPEDGVTGYAFDRTQGPACSLAAAAATVYRNYFAPVQTTRSGAKHGEEGQTRDCQIDNLDELGRALGNVDYKYWEVRNGYTNSNTQRLEQLNEAIAKKTDLHQHIKIGLHQDVEVQFVRRFHTAEEEGARPQRVSQAFCSALSCGYSSVPLEHWEPLARLALEAAYEATLWAAILDHAQQLETLGPYLGRGDLGPAAAGPEPEPEGCAAEGAAAEGAAGELAFTPIPRVLLTFIGGGVFRNDDSWIQEAIGRALAKVQGYSLHVSICHYGHVNGDYVEGVTRFQEKHKL